MKNKALIWIALGGLAVYFLTRKKAQATTQTNGDVKENVKTDVEPISDDKNPLKDAEVLGSSNMSKLRKKMEERFKNIGIK